MRKVVRFNYLGTKDVEWNNFDFHITPCITLNRIKKDGSTGYTLAIEWGHWALCAGLFFININPLNNN